MFPIAFIERMKDLFQDEYPLFMESLGEKRYHALRLNPWKVSKEEYLEKIGMELQEVPWAEYGYYYEEELTPGKHPYHEAGVYYIQEPSAMAPGAYLEAQSGERILDLCAAPGGKSTQIAAAMNQEGILISNEIHPTRAKILSENMERMGVTNCLVTNETPAKLAECWPECFDRIMVDAPCSGEGMFRKNEEAVDQWSEEHVKECANRQDEILDCAHVMLKPGGRIVYSTCTFSPEENEGTIQRFMERHNDYDVEKVKVYEGMQEGEMGTIRLLPHKLHGEGHFVAVLRRKGERTEELEWPTGEQQSLQESEWRQYKEFEQQVLLTKKDGVFIKFKDELYVAPEHCPNLRGIKVLRPGLHLGTLKKDRIEPAHALAHALRPWEVKEEYVTNLDAKNQVVLEYLHGQTFSAEGEKGWHLICVDGYSLGWGKLAGSVMKNHYPKGLRSMF